MAPAHHKAPAAGRAQSEDKGEASGSALRKPPKAGALSRPPSFGGASRPSSSRGGTPRNTGPSPSPPSSKLLSGDSPAHSRPGSRSHGLLSRSSEPGTAHSRPHGRSASLADLEAREAETAVCVALHVRPLISREQQEGCRNLIAPEPGRPEIRWAMGWGALLQG
jgi:hypothetical protein